MWIESIKCIKNGFMQIIKGTILTGFDNPVIF